MICVRIQLAGFDLVNNHTFKRLSGLLVQCLVANQNTILLCAGFHHTIIRQNDCIFKRKDFCEKSLFC